MSVNVLIVDDEPTLRISLQMFLEDEGFNVYAASTLAEGKDLLTEVYPEFLLLDIRLPDGNGLEALQEIKEHHPELGIIMLTAYGDTKTAVQAIKGGAFDYLTKPFELEELSVIIQKWIKQHHLEKEVARYREEERRSGHFEMIGESEQMRELKKKIDLIAQSPDTTVLIRGETGTGKELVARRIHYLSIRNTGPFIAVNCASITPDLIERELFGFEQHGDANEHVKKGLIEWAEGGTLFLDEIGDLSLDIQVKLLRFLENKKVKRLGSAHEFHVDVRVMAATNRSLEEMIKDNQFRSDLYYRLNVVPLFLPTLKARNDDIIMLTEHYLQLYCKQMGKPVPKLRYDAKQRLKKYAWPGNVRELKNIIERIAILHHESEIAAHHLDFIHTDDEKSGTADIDSIELGENFSLEAYVEKVEKQFIEEAIQQTKWNITQAAELLGISRYSLQRRISKYNIT